MTDRRMAIFWVTVEQFMTVMGLLAIAGRVRPVCRNLPIDAKPMAVYYDFLRNAFAVQVEHSSFDLVPEGQILPCLGRLEVEIEPAPWKPEEAGAEPIVVVSQ